MTRANPGNILEPPILKRRPALRPLKEETIPTEHAVQQTKRRVWSYYQAGNRAPQDTPALTASLLQPHVQWHGPHPLGQLSGLEALSAEFWQPLLRALPDVQRRPYLLLGGHFEGSDWVASTGDFVGTFTRDWLGVPATQARVHIRYGEFMKFEGDGVSEVRFLVDVLELIQQAGFDLLPESPGVAQWVPVPLTGDGLLLDPQDPAASAQTLELIEGMIFRGLNRYDQRDQDSQDLSRYWHPHMVWHGPAGIGSAYGLERFKRDAQGPILRALPDRKGVGHKARIAEGPFAASTGWPSLVGTHRETFLGWAPTHEQVGWNIMDFWRRDGDKLLENWVLIDLLGAGLASGVDLLAALQEMRQRR